MPICIVADKSQYPLAFEASLNPDCSELQLTVIAQRACVSEAQATELLDKFEQTFRAILKAAGDIVISKNMATMSGTNGSSHTVNGSSSSTGERAQHGPFKWTKDAIQIRQEIASLAQVDEDKIHEMSSVFELGLDSIDMIKLSARLNKRGIAVPVSTIVKFQTIARISVNLQSNGKRAQQISVGKPVQEVSRNLTSYLIKTGKLPEDTEAVFPATPLQQSMVTEMIKSDYKRYFTVEAFEINEQVEISRLMQAIEHVIRSSPILRTTFIEVDDPQSPVSYAQIVHKNRATSAKLLEEQSLENYMYRLKNNSAALASSSQTLYQTECISVGRKQYLIMAISHALYDGRSLRAIHEDIKTAYRGTFTPRPDSLPHLELVFQSITGDAKRFWRSALSNFPEASFPKKELSEVPNPSVVHRIETPSQVSLSDVESFCRSSRITMQTLGQTCWVMVLSHLMGQLDVVFGSVLACRDSEEAEEVMFPLMNTVPVRSVLHGTVSEMLSYMQEMSDSTRQYQHFSLGTAQGYALASRQSGSSTNDTTLFDTLFIYQGRRQAEDIEPLYKSVYGSSDVEFPICVEMEIVDDDLFWTTGCKSTARTAAEAEGIITALDSVLQRIITSPQAPVIASDADGISVCGLPRFQKHETIQTKVPALPTAASDEDWSDVELKIRQALQQISDVPVETIQKDTTIFHLGLDSILVLKLPALLRKAGVKLSVSSILKNQTVRAMAQSMLRPDQDGHQTLDVDHILSNALSSIDVSSIVKELESEVGEVQTVMPITAGQEYMLRSWQASRGTLFYPTFQYILLGRIDKVRLSNAWGELLKQNDILRTGFVEVGSEILQVVFKDPRTDEDWRASASQPTLSGLSDLRFPPVRLIVENSKIKLEIHHALYDGISLPLLIDQLQSLYRGQALPPQELSFKTFVALSIAASKKPRPQSPCSAETLTQSKWKSYLKYNSSHHSPLASSTGTSNRKTEVFCPSLQVSPLKSTAKNTGVSVDALLLAAISKIYAQRYDQDNAASQVVFGIYLANRAPFGEDLSQLAAPTLNLLPLCVQDPRNRNLTQIAKDIQRDLQEISSAEMSCASLSDIYEWTGIRVDCFVNILKDASPDAAVSNGSKAVEAFIFDSTQDLSPRAEVEDVHPKKAFTTDTRHDVYLVRLYVTCL